MSDMKNSKTRTTTWKKTETYSTPRPMQGQYSQGIGAAREQCTQYCAAGLLSQLGFDVPQGVEMSTIDHRIQS